MEENKQKGIKPKAEAPTETLKKAETIFGVTVGMGVYKPIPRFRGNCKNC